MENMTGSDRVTAFGRNEILDRLSLVLTVIHNTFLPLPYVSEMMKYSPPLPQRYLNFRLPPFPSLAVPVTSRTSGSRHSIHPSPPTHIPPPTINLDLTTSEGREDTRVDIHSRKHADADCEA